MLHFNVLVISFTRSTSPISASLYFQISPLPIPDLTWVVEMYTLWPCPSKVQNDVTEYCPARGGVTDVFGFNKNWSGEQTQHEEIENKGPNYRCPLERPHSRPLPLPLPTKIKKYSVFNKNRYLTIFGVANPKMIVPTASDKG